MSNESSFTMVKERERSPIATLLLNNQWVILLVLTAAIAITTGAINGRFWSIANISSLFQQITVLGLVAAGATILIISGNFDISVDGYVGLAVCIMPMLMNAGWSPILAVVVGILVCVAASTFNGLMSVWFNAPSFIVSLATLGVFLGISLLLTDGLIQTAFGRFTGLIGASVGPIPAIFMVTLTAYVLVYLLLTKTKLGRRVYAIGNNREVAFRSGIAVKRNLLIFFAINGLLVGVASWLLLARVGGGLPSTGTGLAIMAIGAVVIGGAPITGGSGSVIGTFFGVLLLGVIANSLNILNVSPYIQEIAQGVLILLAIGISALRVKLGGRQ